MRKSDRPIYKDETGKLWKDVNLGRGIPGLYSSSDNCFDGEPDMPIKDEFKIVNEPDIPDKDKTFRYMMLSRLRSDCDYYLGYGNRYASVLPSKNEKEHIGHMKNIWNSFSDTEKPEWLSWEQIIKYEKEMLKINNF